MSYEAPASPQLRPPSHEQQPGLRRRLRGKPPACTATASTARTATTPARASASSTLFCAPPPATTALHGGTSSQEKSPKRSTAPRAARATKEKVYPNFWREPRKVNNEQPPPKGRKLDETQFTKANWTWKLSNAEALFWHWSNTYVGVKPPAAPEEFESSAVYATAAITTVIDFSCATGERAALRNGVLRGSNIGMRANMIATASNNFLRRFGAK